MQEAVDEHLDETISVSGISPPPINAARRAGLNHSCGVPCVGGSSTVRPPSHNRSSRLHFWWLASGTVAETIALGKSACA
jgi:hypothetical protein